MSFLIKSIKSSLLAKFLLLLSILAIVAGLNMASLLYFDTSAESNDYTLVTLARQTDLARDMKFAAVEIAEGKSEFKSSMEAYINEYDFSLKGFTNGYIINGKHITAPNEEINSYITMNNDLWEEYKSKAMLLATSEYHGEAHSEVGEAHSEVGEGGLHLEDATQEPDAVADQELRNAFTYIQNETDGLVSIHSQIRQGYVNLAAYHWQLVNQIAALFVSANILIFGIAFLYTRKFINPIKLLKTTMDNVKDGNYEMKARVRSTDEVGSLAGSFNSMIDVIKSRTKELELKNKISERINAHINELVKKESETNAHLQNLTVELRNQAEKLREIDLAKEEFSSMITHELKTPLVPIQGYCELLLDGTLGELAREQKEKIQIIYESSLSLTQLIQDVLDAHKLELGKMNFDMRNAHANDLIDRSIKRFRPVADTKNISIVDKVDQELLLECDPERILQVINNLVSNAVKFVPEQQGRIEVSARRTNGSVLFTVKDNGIGIPKDKQLSLFRKFYQVDASLRRNTTGSGLGLAICKGIVEAHKGRIWLESEEGKGATFCFSIPTGGQN
jgi:signal transduction histidine kinase